MRFLEAHRQRKTNFNNEVLRLVKEKPGITSGDLIAGVVWNLRSRQTTPVDFLRGGHVLNRLEREGKVKSKIISSDADVTIIAWSPSEEPLKLKTA